MIRLASLDDISFLATLEEQCFKPHIRSNLKSLHTSIHSAAQRVFILEKEGEAGMFRAGAAIVYLYRHSIRVFSLAVLPHWQGSGFGAELLEACFSLGRERQAKRITLEANALDCKLVEWYGRFGFVTVQELADYYALGEPAVRMVFTYDAQLTNKDCATIVVVDKISHWPLDVPNVNVVTARDYISATQFQSGSDFRVFNVCNNYNPNKTGYSVSLLASARDHRVIPNVTSLRDLGNVSLVQSLAIELNAVLQEQLKEQQGSTLELEILFGTTEPKKFARLASALFAIFEIPFFRVKIVCDEQGWAIRRVQIVTINTVVKDNLPALQKAASSFFTKKRFRRTKLKQYQYDLAILVNPSEKTPPSCNTALKKFKAAAEEVGFFAEFIDKQDYSRICEFDALFIRETTSVANHTYTFSRRAYAEGLVVVDDPWSILRCSNKIYLYERMQRARVRQPKSWFLTKDMKSSFHADVFPLVLKLPESSFSLGVYKVSTNEELKYRLGEMFKTVELVMAQEFVPSDFDWRIGILDHTPLFACKYHMAEGHWQIYNWEKPNEDSFAGVAETLPLEEVPTYVLRTAVKASSLIGDGLYGVDLKEKGNKASIIEINDNPNIDFGIEDALLGDELYFRIMKNVFDRIEKERHAPRYVSFKED